MAQFIGLNVQAALTDGSTVQGRVASIDASSGVLTLALGNGSRTIRRAELVGLSVVELPKSAPASSSPLADPAIISLGPSAASSSVSPPTRPVVRQTSSTQTARPAVRRRKKPDHLFPETRGSEADESAVPYSELEDDYDDHEDVPPLGPDATKKRNGSRAATKKTARATVAPQPANGMSDDFDFAAGLKAFDKRAVWAELRDADDRDPASLLVSHNRKQRGLDPRYAKLSHTQNVLDDADTETDVAETRTLPAQARGLPQATAHTRSVYTEQRLCPTLSLKQWQDVCSLANIETGPTAVQRVENGGRGIAEVLLSTSGPINGTLDSAVVLCGTGQKAAYALRAGAHLVNRGIAVTAHLAPSETLPPSLELHLRLFSAAGGKVVRSLADLPPSDVALDAILDLEPTVSSTTDSISWLNAVRGPCISIDWPSGVNADTSAHAGVHVLPTATIMVGCVRQGCTKLSAPAVTGSLCVVDVGLPASAFLRTPGLEDWHTPFDRSFWSACSYG